MSDIDHKESNKGIEVGSRTSVEKLVDIDGKTLVFKELLEDSMGILLDFFRGAF